MAIDSNVLEVAGVDSPSAKEMTQPGCTKFVIVQLLFAAASSALEDR